MHALLFFHLFRSFPEEHVRRNRSADHAGNDEKEFRGEFDVRNKRRLQNGAPWFFDKKYSDDIREQSHAKPLQNARISLVSGEYFQHKNRSRKKEHEHSKIHRHNQLRRRSHGAQVGSQVDGVGHHNQHEHSVKHFLAVALLDDGGDAFSRHRSNARAGLLHRNQHGQHQQRRPQLPVAELRPGLGIRSNA